MGEAVVTLSLDADGRIVRAEGDTAAVLGAAAIGDRLVDVVDRRAHAELEDQLFFVQKLVDTIPSPIFYKDENGVYLGCNEAFEAYIGLRREELVGKSVFDISPRELAQRYYEADAKLLASGPGVVQRYEAAVRYADGSHHEVIFFKATFADARGEVAGIIGTMLDITERKLAEAKLAETMADSERLLRRVLPESIAERLKRSTGILADAHAEATVLFADVVGFTSLAERMSAAELVDILNQVFSAFDAIAARFGVEKIKTIGDAYMLVAGVPTARPDHVDAAANVALAMLSEMRRVSEAIGVPLELRIGMHTGPVVAGVIGTQKFLYDLWGDTVNTASRMESHGNPGEIQVTEAVREALGDRFRLRERGIVAVKGKGDMRTFFLVGPRA